MHVKQTLARLARKVACLAARSISAALMRTRNTTSSSLRPSTSQPTIFSLSWTRHVLVFGSADSLIRTAITCYFLLERGTASGCVPLSLPPEAILLVETFQPSRWLERHSRGPGRTCGSCQSKTRRRGQTAVKQEKGKGCCGKLYCKGQR
jgi:hypothetical protein